MGICICTRGRQTGGEEINQTATFWHYFANKRFMQHYTNLCSIIVS